MDGQTLTNQPLKPIEFIVKDLLSKGLFILAGAPKVGKSWLSLQMCLNIALGEKFLCFDSEQAGALYLCLEDSFERIQSRLLDITDDAPPNVHFAVMSQSIGEGLEEQIKDFLNAHPDTKIIIIDTLQKIRKESSDNAYANDYKELTVLKQLADTAGIAILLVHHLRKTKDPDPFNMISGTTGISGCVDGSMVMFEKKRGERKVTLHCVGRDFENHELEIEFNPVTHLWNLNQEIPEETPDNFLDVVCDLVREKVSFSGTATQLLELIEGKLNSTYYPSTVTKKLMLSTRELEMKFILFSRDRKNTGRVIELEYVGDGTT